MGDAKEMVREAKEDGVGFHLAGEVEEVGAAAGVIPGLVKVLGEPGGAFDGEDGLELEARITDFAGEFVGEVKERRGKEERIVVWIVVLAIDKGGLEERLEAGVVLKTHGESGEEGGVAGDGGDEGDAARTEDPMGFSQGGEAAGAAGEVVERAQEEDGIAGSGGKGEGAGVAADGGKTGGAGLGGVLGDEVEERGAVVEGREPGGVNAGGDTDVEDAGGGRREVAEENLAGARELQAAYAGEEARVFRNFFIVSGDAAHEQGSG